MMPYVYPACLLFLSLFISF
uniref:Uncharacterized protein n=1 Tax=Rhizophora mucronata TaxID=61149 RepID=A0A2P2PDZ7_RHIMU